MRSASDEPAADCARVHRNRKGIGEGLGMEERISRGQVHFALLDPVLGCEQGGRRPVVVVSNNIGNRHGSPVIAVPVTTGEKAQLPTHVALGGLGGRAERYTALYEQVRTIDKRRLGRRVGRVGAQGMALIDTALETALALAEDAEALVLCRKCAECFRDSGLFRLRRVDPEETPRETCSVCSAHSGCEYVMTRKKGV